MSDFRPCILIPVYRHGKACAEVVDSIVQYKTPIILVDDGNAEETKNYLNQIVEKYPEVALVALAKNSGKGEAFKRGVIFAHEAGYTHILQVDADGQHDTTRIPFFLEKARENPGNLICGYPEFDESAPNHRKNGHKFANMWCAIITWSDKILDALCGFRVYPAEQTFRFVQKPYDKRMGFDLEILIKLLWKGVEPEFYPVKVSYPTDGISNFHAFRDNVRISWIFTKFFVGMIFRSPLLLWRKIFK